MLKGAGFDGFFVHFPDWWAQQSITEIFLWAMVIGFLAFIVLNRSENIKTRILAHHIGRVWLFFFGLSIVALTLFSGGAEYGAAGILLGLIIGGGSIYASINYDDYPKDTE